MTRKHKHRRLLGCVRRAGRAWILARSSEQRTILHPHAGLGRRGLVAKQDSWLKPRQNRGAPRFDRTSDSAPNLIACLPPGDVRVASGVAHRQFIWIFAGNLRDRHAFPNTVTALVYPRFHLNRITEQLCGCDRTPQR
jgi:hypothetical protein